MRQCLNIESKPVVTSKLGKPVVCRINCDLVGGKKGGGSDKDKDLISTMAMRLSKLELLCDAQRKEIKEKV